MLLPLMLLCVAHAEAPVPDATLRWANTAEGALMKTRTSAENLASVAQAIAAEGRVGQLTVLRAAADELARRADVLVRYTAPESTEAAVP